MQRAFRYVAPIGIWLIYFLITLAVTWPIAPTIGQAVPGSEGDVWVHLWTFRWVRDTLFQGGSFLYTDLMYYPNGVSLTTHNFAWFHILLWIPLQGLVGEAAAYSLIFLIGFSFTAWTTYLFVLAILPQRDLISASTSRITGRHLAAFIAGLVSGYWPYTLSHHNHPNLIFIGFIPLGLLALHRLFQEPTRAKGIWLGLTLGMIGIVRWQLVIYCLPLFLVYGIVLLIQNRKPAQLREVLTYGSVSLLIAGIMISVAMGPILISLAGDSISTDAVSTGETVTGSTDLMAYVVPHFYHPLWGNLFKPLTEPFIVNKVFTPYLGLTVLCLVGLGLVTRTSMTFYWFMTALFYVTFALGPELTINGNSFAVNMPYRLIQGSIIDAIIRRPDRLNIFVSIPFAIMVGHGAQHLLSRLSNWLGDRGSQDIFLPIGALCLIGLILLEFWNRYPIYTLDVPAWHRTLEEEEGEFAILELPMHARVYDELYMQYQATHGKSLVGGHVSRLPAEALTFIEDISFLSASETIGPNRQSFSITEDLVMLAQSNVRYIVLHKYLLNDEQLDNWRRFLILQPMYEDGDVVVYSTDLPIDQTLTPKYEFTPASNLGLIDYDVSVPAPTQAGLIQTGFVWLSAETIPDQIEACLVLYTEGMEIEQESCDPLTYFESEWPAKALNHTNHTLEISPYLDPDDYHLGIKLLPSEAFLSLGPVDINVVERHYTLDKSIDTPADLVWNKRIGLLGYEFSNNTIDLYWQAKAEIDQDLVRFIHITDPRTGELVGQVDSIPRNWGYPTNWWKAEEIIEETVQLPYSVEELEENGYQVYLGFYDRSTVERIKLESQKGQFEISNDAALLAIKP